MSYFGAPSVLNPTIISSLLFMGKSCFLTVRTKHIQQLILTQLSVILMRNVGSPLCCLIFANSKDTLLSQRLSRLREADCKVGRFLLVLSQACHCLSKPRRVRFLVTKELLEISHHAHQQPAAFLSQAQVSCLPLLRI